MTNLDTCEIKLSLSQDFMERFDIHRKREDMNSIQEIGRMQLELGFAAWDVLEQEIQNRIKQAVQRTGIKHLHPLSDQHIREQHNDNHDRQFCDHGGCEIALFVGSHTEGEGRVLGTFEFGNNSWEFVNLEKPEAFKLTWPLETTASELIETTPVNRIWCITHEEAVA